MKRFRSGPLVGHLSGPISSGGPTYAKHPTRGYGIYARKNHTKTLRTNDGYKLVQRTDPHKRLSKPVFAKCVLDDPDQVSGGSGIVRLVQGPYDRKTTIWASLTGGDKLTINALGDLTNGCDGAGPVFDPCKTPSGFPGCGQGYDAPVAGDLGAVSGSLEAQADIDLSGSQSAIGRSMVLSSGDTRIACCTIGLSAGPKAPPKPQQSVVYNHQPHV